MDSAMELEDLERRLELIIFDWIPFITFAFAFAFTGCLELNANALSEFPTKAEEDEMATNDANAATLHFILY